MWNKLLKFVALRPRSQKEISDWFRRKKVREDLQTELNKRLKSLDLVDDEEFAKWWIEQRREFKPMGVKRLKFELKQKGVNNNVISSLLSEFINTYDQKNLAMKILEKKIERLKKMPRMIAFQKAYRLLASRGFDSRVIESAIDELGLKR